MSFSFIHGFNNTNQTWILVKNNLYLAHNDGEGIPLSINGYDAVAIKKDVKEWERDSLAEKKRRIKKSFVKSPPIRQKKNDFFSLITDSFSRDLENYVFESECAFSIMAEKHVGSPFFRAYFREPSSLQHALVSLLGKGEAYACSKDEAYLLGPGESVQLSGKSYGIARSISLEQLVARHEALVERRLKKHWKGIDGLYTQQEKNVQEAELAIEERAGKLVLSATIPQYCVRSFEGDFVFDACTLGVPFMRENNTLRLVAYPQITSTREYDHPFKYNGNNICFAGSKRYTERSIDVGTQRMMSTSLDELKKLAADVAFCASTGVNTLRNGYGRFAHPYHYIGSFASRKREEQDLVKLGVKPYNNRH